MQIIDRIAQFHDDIRAIRRDLHAHPELRFEEKRTSDIVASFGIVIRGIVVNLVLLLSVVLPLATLTLFANPDAKALEHSVVWQALENLFAGSAGVRVVKRPVEPTFLRRLGHREFREIEDLGGHDAQAVRVARIATSVLAYRTSDADSARRCCRPAAVRT